MLIDLLNSANYIMVNKDAIKLLGLNTAIYCAELLNIYKKAVIKHKLINDIYFKIDRKYITNQTSLSVDDQILCDKNLISLNIIKLDDSNSDIIYFDVEKFASILSSEDVKLLKDISNEITKSTLKKEKEDKAEAKRAKNIDRLKSAIRCNTPEVLYALKDWIDAVMADPKKYLSVPQVELFKNKLDDYCDGDLNKALAIIRNATVHQYVDCQWAINSYEKDLQVQANLKAQAQYNTPRITEQRRTIKLSGESF